MRKSGVFCALLLAVRILCTQASDQTESRNEARYNWLNPNDVIVNPREMSFTAAKLPAAKNESLYVWAYGNDGTVFLMCLFHIESILVDRWGFYVLAMDPEGNVHWYTENLAPSSVWHAETRLAVKNGTVEFSGTDGRYMLHCEVGEFSSDLYLTSRLPPWKPGTGTVDYSPDGNLYQTRILVAPLAEVTGILRIGDRTYGMDGYGSIEKNRFSNPLSRFAPYLHGMRLYGDDAYLYLLDVMLNEAYGAEAVAVLAFAYSDEWVITTPDFRFEICSWEDTADGTLTYPVAATVDAESGGYRLVGTITERTPLGTTDVMSELPGFLRVIVQTLLSRPMYARSVVRFSGYLTTPDGTEIPVTLNGPYEYAVVE